MGRLIASIVATLTLAATPAYAAPRTWGAPEPIAGGDVPAIATTFTADVAGDGTTATLASAWTAHTVMGAGDTSTLTAAVGSHAATSLVVNGLHADGDVAALPGGRAVAVFNTTANWQDGAVTYARFAGSDGVFGSAQDVGPGVFHALDANRAGDVVAVFGDPGGGQLYEAFAPAGGSFGSPVPLVKADYVPDVELSDDGEATILASSYDVSRGLVAVSRLRDGAVTSPAMLSVSPALAQGPTFPALASDAQGRTLAVWAEGKTLGSAVGRGGTWSAPTTTAMPASPSALRAASDPAGDAVVVWRDASALGTVRVASVSLADGRLSDVGAIDQPSGGDVELAVGPDGSAIIGFEASAPAPDSSPLTLNVLRRTGTEPFGQPEIAGCSAPSGSTPALGGAWLTDAGDATLLTDTALLRDRPGPAPPPPCSLPGNPRLRVAARSAGRVRVRVMDSTIERLRLTWRARGHILVRRTVTPPATVTLHATRFGREVLDRARVSSLVLRRGGAVVAVGHEGSEPRRRRRRAGIPFVLEPEDAMTGTARGIQTSCLLKAKTAGSARSSCGIA
ncbi:MAG: hypothetical protein QOF76_5327 [Solirubrobacteraceae bacterium]|jgi:hypothetical protein|nr:hypothetical protein [Solirubrobacteraceae bacterium]